jgi:6,7-dimethyl-8-ribityllumazine synthase
MSFTPNTSAATPVGRTDLRELEPNPAGAGLAIGIVMARFNKDVGEGLLSGCAHELQRLGVTDVTLASVPGALEIPLALQTMAQSGKFAALVALGCVIRGERILAGRHRRAADHRHPDRECHPDRRE